MEDFGENIFLKAAFGGKIQQPTMSSRTSISTSNFTSTLTGSSATSSSRMPSKKSGQRKPNVPRHTYSKMEDQLILKAVELCGRDWRAVLAFLKRNWEVLGKEGEIYRDCDVGDKSMHDRLRKRAAVFLSKAKDT